MKAHRTLRIPMVVAITAALVAVWPGQAPAQVPPMPLVEVSDAGPYAWARQAIPALLGRKARGANEIQLVGDIAQQVGRGTTAWILMSRPEFHEHWAEFFADRLRAGREPPSDSNPNKYQGGCFKKPLGASPDDPTLARTVRDNPASANIGPGFPFNMSDLIRSSLALDDLTPMYRGSLFAMVNQPIDGAQTTEQMRRDDIGEAFETAYLGRNLMCATCHNAAFSTTGPASGWNRHFPIRGDFEDALFGWGPTRFPQALDPVSHFAVFDTAIALHHHTEFQALQSRCGNRPAQHPWQTMDDGGAESDGCGAFCANNGEDPTLADAGVDAFFGAIRSTRTGADVWALDDHFRQGADKLRQHWLSYDGTSVIDGLPAGLDPDEAFVFLTSANIVNEVWTEVMGYPLDMAHHFSRNQGQRDILWSITQRDFAGAGFSLKRVLARMVSSRFFDRVAPREDAGTPIYDLPMVFDPLVAHPPSVGTQDPNAPLTGANDEFNAMTDAVHRYSAHSLLYSVSKAMGWPGPRRFPDFASAEMNTALGDPPADDSTYPNLKLTNGMGQFYTDAQPGTSGVSLDAVLRWEDAHGICQNRSGGPDYLDRLVAAVAQQMQSGPVKVREPVAALKLWLLGTDVILETPRASNNNLSERQIIESTLGASLDDTIVPKQVPKTNIVSIAWLEGGLRLLCGVFVETGQFMLAGIAPSAAPQASRFSDVCNDAAPCTYARMCTDFAGADTDLVWDCSQSPVVVTRPPSFGLCPPATCNFIPFAPNTPCWAVPGGCYQGIPPWDPRCTDESCSDLRQGAATPNDAFLAWADGGLVNAASGVLRVTPASSSPAPLAVGTVVNAGDVLLLAGGASLQIDTGEAHFETPSGGMPSPGSAGYWVFMVTGPALLGPPAQPVDTTPPLSVLLSQIQSTPWLAYGTAGPPCSADYQSDANNCGQCGHSCDGGACNAGLCAPVTVASGQGQITSIAVDPVTGEVYWTSYVAGPTTGTGTASVNRAAHQGSAPTVLASTNDGVYYGVAIDDDQVYWAHQGSVQAIETTLRTAGTSSGIATLASGEPSPMQVAVDPGSGATGSVFWTGHAATGGVVRQVSKLGGAPRTLADQQGTLSALAVGGGFVYWLDVDNASVLAAAESGTGSWYTLAANQGTPYGLATSGSSVLWTDYSGGTVKELSLGATGSSSVVVVGFDQAGTHGVVSDRSSVYWSNLLTGTIWRSALGGDGSAMALYLTPSGSSGGLGALALGANAVYWSSSDGSIQRLAK